MAPQPRWTVPVNMRSQDKQVLDAALEIARKEGIDITTIFRTALAEFVRTRVSIGRGARMDEFLDSSMMLDPNYNRILTAGPRYSNRRRHTRRAGIRFSQFVRSCNRRSCL